MSASELSTREFNMAKRRARILQEARKVITRAGFDALNLRALARAAEVTVPTIYNLIGNKEALIIALFEDVLGEIESRVVSHRDAAPLALAESAVIESIALFAEDEDYYRAAFVAVEYLDQTKTHHAVVESLYCWGERLIIDGFNACLDAGLLRGRIPTDLLGNQVLHSYRTNCRAWAFAQQPVEAFRTAALTDIYINLAADAVETFHATLTKKIAAINGAVPPENSKRPRGEGAVR